MGIQKKEMVIFFGNMLQVLICKRIKIVIHRQFKAFADFLNQTLTIILPVFFPSNKSIKACRICSNPWTTVSL